ncbi:MAG: thiamine-phosphate kinase [Dehalococcoidia bacterium]|nr:thiamine-phosphate kinase [Dehalococcoidia bacterium]
MKVKEIGEFALIKRLSSLIAKKQGGKPLFQNLILGIGDDTAAWHNTSHTTLATTDCLVQNIHFRLEETSWYSLGWKALSVNLSDIAAMGGKAEYALVTLGLPPDCLVANVEEIYYGILDLAQQSDTIIVGGDISSSATIFINVALTGSTHGRILKRDGAQPGDQIAVTGYLGLAAGGLNLISERGSAPASGDLLKQSFWQPIPRLAEGTLLQEKGASACIDISDGLVSDLKHICHLSEVSAHLYLSAIPLHPTLQEHFNQEALNLALNGGEDYELLFTAAPHIMSSIAGAMTTPCHVIGTIENGENGEVHLFNSNGGKYHLEKTGWDHFA